MTASGEPLRIHISDVAVELSSDHRPTRRGLQAAWRSATRALLPAKSHHRIATRQHASGKHRVVVDGQLAMGDIEPMDLLASVETQLYHRIRAWHANRLLLHAACVQAESGQLVVLLGESGAGKSSLARAAVQSGFRYFSDELTVIDGQRGWGIPRTIQFDPLGAEAPCPGWLGAVDRASYQLRHLELGNAQVPLHRLDERALASAPASTLGIYLVQLRRAAATCIRQGTPLQALAWLHEAAHQQPNADLGHLVHRGRCFELAWSNPAAGLGALVAHIGRDPRGARHSCSSLSSG